jgi:hypothetical protein
MMLGLAVGALALGAAPAMPAASANKGSVQVKGGTLAPGGTALIAGTLPKGKEFAPKSYALATGTKYTATAIALGAGPLKAAKGRLSAMISLPDLAPTGSFNLLACPKAKPSAKSCVATGKLKIAPVATIPTATPTLDPAHAASAFIGIQGGSIVATGADGTKYTLTVAPHGMYGEEITVTPVTALTPASAVGKVVDGVMITPGGEAPAGSTLEIKRASAPPAHTRAVGFGGIDPSNGAFALPGRVRADTTLDVETFGGYALATPASGHAADIRPRAVACQSDHVVARAATGAAAPAINCTSAAARDSGLSSAWQAADALPTGTQREAAFIAAYEAAMTPITSEIDRVVKSKPTEQGSAELDELIVIGTGIERQAVLSGLPDEATGQLLAALYAAADYKYRLIKSVCLGPQAKSDIFISYEYEALAASRIMELFGAPPPDLVSVVIACADRVKLQVAANDDATIDLSGGWTSHVVVTDNATVSVDPNLQFVVSNKNLTFTTAHSQADPALVAQGGSASMTAESGTLNLDKESTGATWRVICNGNQFTFERHTYFYVTPTAIWADGETVTLSVNGGSVFQPDAVAASSWLQIHPLTAQKPPPIVMEIGGAPFTESNSGLCTVIGSDVCTTYAYSASLATTALVN